MFNKTKFLFIHRYKILIKILIIITLFEQTNIFSNIIIQW